METIRLMTNIAQHAAAVNQAANFHNETDARRAKEELRRRIYRTAQHAAARASLYNKPFDLEQSLTRRFASKRPSIRLEILRLVTGQPLEVRQ